MKAREERLSLPEQGTSPQMSCWLRHKLARESRGRKAGREESSELGEGQERPGGQG